MKALLAPSLSLRQFHHAKVAFPGGQREEEPGGRYRFVGEGVPHNLPFLVRFGHDEWVRHPAPAKLAIERVGGAQCSLELVARVVRHVGCGNWAGEGREAGGRRYGRIAAA